MSLLRAVIRATAVGALRDKTWAEDRVYNSDMTPLAEAVVGTTAKPYIVVYTDADDLMPVGGKAELYDGANRALSVVLEIGVASAIRPPAGGHLVLQFAATDEGMELACDVIEAQAIAALVGDPQSKFGDLFKRMIGRVTKMPRRRGGQASQGIRYAARRVTLVCSTIYDLAPGVVPIERHPVRDFITLARDNPDIGLVDYATIAEGLLVTDNAPTWRQAQSYLGLSTAAIKHLNPDGTPLPWPERETPPLEEDPNEFVPMSTDIILVDDPFADE